MALKIALDINCYRDFCAGDREVLDRLQLAERVVLPFVTLAELRAGSGMAPGPARTSASRKLPAPAAGGRAVCE